MLEEHSPLIRMRVFVEGPSDIHFFPQRPGAKRSLSTNRHGLYLTISLRHNGLSVATKSEFPMLRRPPSPNSSIMHNGYDMFCVYRKKTMDFSCTVFPGICIAVNSRKPSGRAIAARMAYYTFPTPKFKTQNFLINHMQIKNSRKIKSMGGREFSFDLTPKP